VSPWFPKLNVVIAAIVVTIGFALIWNPIPIPVVALAGVGFAGLLLWLATTPRHAWAWASLFLGLESISWPVVQLIKLRLAGIVEPSEEQMRNLVSNLFLGVLFATFWLTLAYGIFRWIRRSEGETTTAKP
jgi:hypothetical protein